MKENNIGILGIITYIPWRYEDWDLVYEGLDKFSKALVERYKSQGVLAKSEGWENYGIRYWEIFNEPNLPGYGWLSKNNEPSFFVDEYVYSLAVVNKAIRKVDRDAIIVLGGLSPSGMDPYVFLNKSYNSGMKDCFDIMAFHPYGYDKRFDQAKSELIKAMKPFGDEHKTIWFNEYGTGDDDIRTNLLENAFKEKNIVEGFFWFSLRDLSKYKNKFGLMNYDYSEKIDYSVFKKLNKKN